MVEVMLAEGVVPRVVVDASPEEVRRTHTIVEQVIADLKGSALAHQSSSVFAANAAWLAAACLAYNLNRAAGGPVLGLPRPSHHTPSARS